MTIRIHGIKMEERCKNRLAGVRVCLPLREAGISSSGRPSETVRSVRSGPRAGPCPFTQCFSRHTDKGTQIPREKSPLGVCFCGERVCTMSTYTHRRVRWQPRREISYEITGSHSRGSPLASSPPFGLHRVDH